MRSKLHGGQWRETLVLTLVTAVLVAVLAWKGITTYFFAEAFVYLGTYREAGDSFLGALLRPHAGIFYRPSLWAVNLAWNLIAPPDALLYHLRNYAFVIINALLLHRLLLRFVPNAFGRAAGILYYAVSKVHLTTIGYVATFSTILLLLATLSMFLAFCRWLDERRTIDYAATLFFAAFLIFSKDYGAVAVLMLPVLAWLRRAPMASLRSVAVPLIVLIAIYAGLRAWVAPPLPATGDYVPRLETGTTVIKTAQAVTTLANLSLFESEGRTGARGVTGLIWPDGSSSRGRIAEGVLLIMFAVLAIGWWFIARPDGRLMVFCAAWSVLYFAPTLLTRNQQLYYHNDVVAAAAVLFAAMSARSSGRRAAGSGQEQEPVSCPPPAARRPLPFALLLVLAANAFVSQQSMRYGWYELSEKTRPLERIARRYRDSPITRVLFLTSDPGLWSWALQADGLAPFVPALFGRDVDVRVLERTRYRGGDHPHELVIDIDAGMKVTWRRLSGGAPAMSRRHVRSSGKISLPAPAPEARAVSARSGRTPATPHCGLS